MLKILQNANDLERIAWPRGATTVSECNYAVEETSLLTLLVFTILHFDYTYIGS